MKKIVILFVTMFALCGISAQTLKTHTETFIIGVCPGVDVRCKETYTYYVDGKGNYVRHGKYTLIGNEPVRFEYKGSDFTCSYSFSANYKDGMLDGTMKKNLKVKGRYRTIGAWLGKDWNVTETLSANYSKGKLNGVWQYYYKDVSDDDNYENTALIHYSNGLINGDFKVDINDLFQKTTFRGHATNGLCDGKFFLDQDEYVFAKGALLSYIFRNSYGQVSSSNQIESPKLIEQIKTDLSNGASKATQLSHGYKTSDNEMWLSWEFYSKLNKSLSRNNFLIPMIDEGWYQFVKLVDVNDTIFPFFYVTRIEVIPGMSNNEVTSGISDSKVIPVMSDSEFIEYKSLFVSDYRPIFITSPIFDSISKSIINTDSVIINEESVSTVFEDYLQSDYLQEKNADYILQEMRFLQGFIGDRTISESQTSELKKQMRQLEVFGIKDYLIKERKERIKELTRQQLVQDIKWLNGKSEEIQRTSDKVSNAFWPPIWIEKSSMFDSAKVEQDSCYLFCTLLRKNSVVGWETWSCIYTLTSPYMHTSDERALTNFTFLKCLPNEWDNVRSLRDSIIIKEGQIQDMANALSRDDIFSAYKRERFEIDENHLDATAYLQSYNNIMHKQEEYLQLLEMVKLISSQSKQILEDAAEIVDVYDNFRTFCDTMNLKMDDSVENCISSIGVR